jgi:PTH1 family peptidyl-tRNA hydrolase
MDMWLVVGLGNPGAKYERNRHNIGFRVVDELARKHALPAWSNKLGGDVTSGVITTERGRAKEIDASGRARQERAGERAHVLKPLEFMNLSGFAVQRTAAFHKVDVEHVLVVHDEIDLPFGTVRLKNGGGHGGHNGLRSIIEQLGSDKFARVRMGVGRDPNAQGAAKQTNAAAGWVLSDFPAAQATIVTAMIAAGCECIECVLAKGITGAMNQHNARPNLAGP